jgi:hypothetical protein
MQICCFNILFGAQQVEDVILFICKLSKFIVFIFKIFQSLELIKYVFCYLTLVIGSTIFMNILIHHPPPIINMVDLLHNDIKKKCLHIIPAKLWTLVLVVKLDETGYVVQIYIILPFEAQMV